MSASHPTRFALLALLFAGTGTGASAQFEAAGQVLCDPCRYPLVADMDLDGDPDLILSDPSLESIKLLLNQGNGQFAAEEQIAVNLSALQLTLAADVDSDGDVDLIGTSATDQSDSLVALLRNNGDLTFLQDTIDHPIATTGALDQLVDLDGDGLPDLLSLRSTVREYWYRALGGGSYAREAIPLWCADTGGPYVALDVDGDSDMDLARFDTSDSRIITLWDLGGGHFGPWTWATPTVAVNGHPDMDTLDADADGLTDLVLGGRVLYSNGNGTFTTADVIFPSDFQTIGNVDCDPAPEALLSSSTDDLIVRRALDPTGQIIPIALADPPDRSRNGLHDLDLDGRLDLLLGPPDGPGVVRWHRNIAEPVAVALELPGPDTVDIDAVIPLSGGTPVDGGWYTGEGVFSNTLYAFAAGPGMVVITYHYLSFTTQDYCGGEAIDSLYIADFTGVPAPLGSRVRIRPIPADEELWYDAPVTTVMAVRVLDGLGRERMRGSGPFGAQGSIETRSFANGAYILELIGETGPALRTRFVVAHAGRW